MSHPALAKAEQAERAGDFETAVSHYAAVLEADPGCVEALNNLGAIAHRSGQYQSAIDFQRQALEHRPDFTPARINLARTLAKTGDIKAASTAYHEAILHGGDAVTLKSEHVQLLYGAGELEAARRLADAACDMHPDSAEMWLVAGNTRLYQRDPAGAENCYRRAMQLADTSRARANLALALLAQGRFAEAWPLYEARYDATLGAHDAVRFPALPWPQWQGEPLAGKRVLVMGEQGMGDQLHFARFLSRLAAQGAHVELVCTPALLPLLREADGVRAVHEKAPLARTFDYWSPLLSLPWRLGDLDGREWPGSAYLKADDARRGVWRTRLAEWAGTRRRVGLAWAGSPGNAIDRMRSLALDDVLALVQGLGQQAMFFSLQKGTGELEGLQRQCAAGIIPLSDMIGDFADTAALIAELDLVICVDTAVAHVAGALGKEAWVMLSPGADWRWGAAGAAQCALYPALRPFWKAPGETNADVVARLRAALETALRA